MAQAVPGPRFTFSAYLGAVSKPAPNGWLGGLIALIAIFLPSFLFVIDILPFWNRLRSMGSFQASLRGINAAVVGILLAALYQPIWTTTIHAPVDFALGLLAFGHLLYKARYACSVVRFLRMCLTPFAIAYSVHEFAPLRGLISFSFLFLLLMSRP